ncbi:Holliday junction resolvase RuvX [Comamonas testosteroni]|uniref:Holliday junction resolvase RuvX n=1 Tax=Comamonas testosteroni TaxID=285 RepID=UPI0026F2A356|nr:Holliday junction resolvase RuvX [Comamonas testosteroni]WQD42370.1 Holliday junction resolvase RuvX [Comamonas testosteroni]
MNDISSSNKAADAAFSSTFSSAENVAARPASAPAPQKPEVPAHFQQFLGFDFGIKRTGCASGNRVLGGANPLPTIKAEGADARLTAVEKLIREWQPNALVIGVPYHPDGAAHENTARALKFGRQLRSRFKLPVYEVDERYSTTEALAGGARDADAASACIILEQFLRSLP